mmetsp:Transcript_12331/g.35824  ORF Transcript_12331/g.35824 Transcript_12331/m.35824 type:complete len:129 (+) Transcript_12331:46-432(+)
MPCVVCQVIDESIDDLNYGVIGLNSYSLNTILFPQSRWGSGKGGTPFNIQSGCGSFGNLYLYDDVEKSVIKSPFLNLLCLAEMLPFTSTSHLKTYRRISYAMARRNNTSVVGTIWELIRISVAMLFGI